VEVEGVKLTTPAVEVVDVPVTDSDHTKNVVDYIHNTIRHTVGINTHQQLQNYTSHGTDNTNGKLVFATAPPTHPPPQPPHNIGAVGEANELAEKFGVQLTHYGEELHILHNIMLKNSYLEAWPDKGFDDATPLSVCRKWRYVMKVLPPLPHT
jgi:hypothetical protein